MVSLGFIHSYIILVSYLDMNRYIKQFMLNMFSYREHMGRCLKLKTKEPKGFHLWHPLGIMRNFHAKFLPPWH